MKTILIVNRNVLAANKKHGRDDPPLTVRTYKGSQLARRVRIDGPSDLVYSPEKPLHCGARVWIETQSQVEILS